MLENTIHHALETLFHQPVLAYTYETNVLQGGTVGQVDLVTGTANINGETKNFTLVYKYQKQWSRFKDPESWRREYDLYNSTFFSTIPSFQVPNCYYAEMNAEENAYCLWLQYVEGASGLQLTVSMLTEACYQLGQFQGHTVNQLAPLKQTLRNVSDSSLMIQRYRFYRALPAVYDFIRQEDCPIPSHLCALLIEFDLHADDIIEQIQQLPVTFNHRDFWNANILATDDKIYVIDWDTSGFANIGEDIASLIIDESHPSLIATYYKQLIPAFYKGFYEQAPEKVITNPYIYEMILLQFGYRLIENYVDAETVQQKEDVIQAFEQLHEIRTQQLLTYP